MEEIKYLLEGDESSDTAGETPVEGVASDEAAEETDSDSAEADTDSNA